MNFLEYQELAERTSGWAGEQSQDRIVYASLAISGEVGELANHVKKGIFHGHGLDIEYCRDECSDILWYLSEICSALDLTLDEVAEYNIGKLKKRYPEGYSDEASINRKS
jgi:NTP pyrophosphatase (non-canonical NTP hydrolase)